MSKFTGPAHEATDKRLFAGAPKALAALHRQSRKELRKKARAEYWDRLQDATSKNNG